MFGLFDRLTPAAKRRIIRSLMAQETDQSVSDYAIKVAFKWARDPENAVALQMLMAGEVDIYYEHSQVYLISQEEPEEATTT